MVRGSVGVIRNLRRRPRRAAGLAVIVPLALLVAKNYGAHARDVTATFQDTRNVAASTTS